jgi:hypothetical protein
MEFTAYRGATDLNICESKSFKSVKLAVAWARESSFYNVYSFHGELVASN